MKILLIHNFYQYRGGEDVYVDLLNKLLIEHGHDVILYSKNSKNIDAGIISQAKIALDMFSNKNQCDEFRHIILNFRPNIVHFNNIYPLLTPELYDVCNQLMIPTVQTIHTYRYFCPKSNLFKGGKICELCVNKKFSYPAIFYKCYHKSYSASLFYSGAFLYHKTINKFKTIKALIFPSNFTKEYYLKYLDISSNNIFVVPHFTFNNIKQNKAKKQSIEKYFIYVGRLSEEKGILQLVKLFTQLADKNLLVLGDGPLRKELDSFRKFKNIDFRYNVSDDVKSDLIHNSIFTIIPSQVYEQGPLVLMESFASGTPVLAPYLGPIKERIKHEKTGLFFNPGDMNDLKNKIILVSKGKYNLNKMRRNVINEYKKYYTPEKYYKSLMKIYNKISN